MATDRSSVSDHYLSEAGRRYASQRQPDPYGLGFQLNFEYFEPHLRRSDVVLDFGCGNGGMLRLLGQYVSRAEGLEVNPHAAQMARASGHTVYSRLEDLPEVPRFDAVVSNHVLEHVRDVPGTLERVRQSMKPGALLLLKLPINDWRARSERRWSREDVDHHLQTWTPKLIANVLYESGYDVEQARIVTSAWHGRLFPLRKLGLGRLAFWPFAVLARRRQLFVIGRVPS
jgi:2-polyprenyl-3-methyl-5-hydroxy-6-metoxy-1,4-benzoquinol methylase